jgi:peptidoglycan hydrolase-like protein with peptidoglycan-binding domain
MTEQRTLQNLIDDGRVSIALRQGSKAQHAISTLQTLLHWLGFDRELKWARFGADGDYGRATTAAVAAFAKRNGSKATGSRVSGALAEAILARYNSLEELKQLAGDVDGFSVEKHYRRGSTDRLRIAALQTLLRDLGFEQELKWDRFGADGDYGRSTTSAVTAFAKQEGLKGDGQVLTQDMARRLVGQLSRYYGSSWRRPNHKPTPAPRSLSVVSILGNKNRQYLEVSDGIRKKRFGRYSRGLYNLGDQKPSRFITMHADRLRALRLTQSEINVMISVAENEGNLDAINSWDNAFLSFGLFQWTAGQGSTKGELPALLARIREEDHDLFDKYCGQHGLDVTDITPGPVHGYFSFNGVTLKSPKAKAQLREAPWAFYFWLAGQDPAIQAIEIKHALYRLDQFYDTDRYLVDNRYHVSELVTSEYGVGLILDQHVNRPAHVKSSLAKALKLSALPDPKNWDTEAERRLLESYLSVRARTSMTDPEKRARVTRKYLSKGIISDARGSFKRSTSRS